jgi:hypothetical protein
MDRADEAETDPLYSAPRGVILPVHLDPNVIRPGVEALAGNAGKQVREDPAPAKLRVDTAGVDELCTLPKLFVPTDAIECEGLVRQPSKADDAALQCRQIASASHGKTILDPVWVDRSHQREMTTIVQTVDRGYEARDS